MQPPAQGVTFELRPGCSGLYPIESYKPPRTESTTGQSYGKKKVFLMFSLYLSSSSLHSLFLSL